MNGKLYIIATPIGNLGDITLRALETFKRVDLILCEDTRVSKNLLDHYEINKKLVSFHQHSEIAKFKEIENLLLDGKNIGLVTDAGTPGISDPGGLLIEYLVKKGLENNIMAVPGVSAVIMALSISGFPTDRFTFMGFPPHKNKRQKYFKEVAQAEETVVFYESGHRIMKCLQELKENMDAKRQMVVCRELTKKFETVYRGAIEDIMENMKDERGEFVVVISRK